MDYDAFRSVLQALERVASARTLYRMKRDTVRLKDRADAALLRDRFGLDEGE